jgi:GNAT superfamily N-acetyltransferase
VPPPPPDALAARPPSTPRALDLIVACSSNRFSASLGAHPNRVDRLTAGGELTSAAMEYRYGNNLDLDRVVELYHASTLGERRPMDDRAIVRDMLAHANLVVTAWDGELLVGIARTLTDFSYVGYLADLAVRTSHQRQGIGVELIRKTRERMGPRSGLVLLAAPKAADYYPRLGFRRHDSAWILDASEPLAGDG